MKYYSELTKKIYDCESDLIADEESVVKAKEEKEAKAKQLKEERANRAKAVEDAYKLANEKQAEADKLMREFIKDYGSFHTTVKDVKPGFTSLIDYFFGNF
jgi:regulator of protease activity HflC (stomatin/prohibitin superfamily)